MIGRLLIAGWLVLGVVLWPLVALGVLLHPRLRPHARERLGFFTPEVDPGALCFHAASLGEARVVDALVPALAEAHRDVELLRTCTSPTARRAPAAEVKHCAPVDVLPSVLAWLDRVRPRAVVLVEAELWPALLVGCRWRGIPVVRLSPRSGPGEARLRKVPGLLEALGAGLPTVEPRLDLKARAPARRPGFAWRGDALLAACTHDGEEAAILDAWTALSSRAGDARRLLILAPRDLDRVQAIAGLVARRGLRMVRRSAVKDVVPAETEVVLLDTVGDLAGLYLLVRAAFVGGTFDPAVGGHSPAEGVAGGCPLVRGPHVNANADAWARAPADVAAHPAGLADALRAALARTRVEPVGPDDAAARTVRELGRWIGAPTPPERALRPWLWPLGLVWLALAALRPARLVRAPIPVLSVGGLTAGGSGKTPVSAWLAERLPGAIVVARGYGRRRGRDARMRGGATELGDELSMLARRGLPVVSSPNRLLGVRTAATAGGLVAVLDDAFQARGVARDLDIVVLDARWPDGGGPIPVGSRRERRAALARADVIWSHHGPAPDWARALARPDALWVRSRLGPLAWRHRGRRLPLAALPPRPVAAIAGIARPSGFFRLLRRMGLPLEQTRVFGDHHAFGWSDLQAIEAWKDDLVVVVTEKDAARLPEGLSLWALEVGLVIEEGADALAARLAPFGFREPE
jgi:tetraacyldisaccharide 4'-kinase